MKAMNCLFALLACLAFVSCESEDAPETYQTELPYLELVIPQSREDNFKNADIMEEAN